MAIEFRILPEHGFVFIRFEGCMGIAESTEAMGRFTRDPDYRKGMKQLVDLSAVTDWERDFPALMQHLAAQADLYDDPSHPVLIACLAPTEIARSAASVVARAWDRSQRVVVVIVDTEVEALAVLGLEALSFAELPGDR